MHEPQDGETSLVVSRYAEQGVTERMLSRVETEYGLRIPPTYRAFLSLVGNNPQAVPDWVGSDWTGDCLSAVQAGARDLVRNNPHLTLPEEAFVLLLHQGYSALFVHAGLGDGSPVYAYAETDEPALYRTSCL